MVTNQQERDYRFQGGGRIMENLKRTSIILELLDELKKNGSWCGETHIQKAMYFLQEMAGVPTNFTYILYKHGPFSFDFRDELTSLRADGLLELSPQPYPYGPSLSVTDIGRKLKENFPKTLKRYQDNINFIAQNLGDKGVADLERLATALYVTLKNEAEDVNVLADIMCAFKPHISTEQAREATEKVKEMIRAA
jgi:uncharacterized protein YwgA